MFNFFQIAYVVSDLEQAMRAFRALQGIERFQTNRDVKISTRAGPANLHFALAFVGAQQIELIEPAGGADGVYRDALPREGFAMRLHHLGHLTRSDDEWRHIQAAVAASGRETAVAGTFEHEGVALMHYLYVDTRAELGHYLEYMCQTEAGRDLFAAVPRFPAR